jgi:hypothetical protein
LIAAKSRGATAYSISSAISTGDIIGEKQKEFLGSAGGNYWGDFIYASSIQKTNLLRQEPISFSSPFNAF